MLVELCEDQERLIRKQDAQINELQNQLAGYEQELYENERKRLISEETNSMEDMR